MFQVFRRHQRRWLTALTILAMIGFAFPLGSTYFGSRSGGRAVKGPEVVETIFKHRVTTDDLTRARLERLVANTFAQQMILTVHPELGMRLGPDWPFGPIRDDEAIKEAIRLSYKADQLGVRVNDDMVRSWINGVTGGKLTNAQFDQVVAKTGRAAPNLTGETGTSADIIFEILKKQMRIDSTRDLIMGRFGDGPMPVAPYESWQFYRKLNDKLGLEVIPVHVVDFAAQIEDPGDTVLRDLYDTYISELPNPASPEPGFKEPRRVNLQYVSVALKDFALAMRPELEVTEDEIKQYYDSHKDLYRIRPAAPTLAPTAPTQPPIEPSDATEKKKEESENSKDPDSKQPGSDEKKGEPKSQPDSENKTDSSGSTVDNADNLNRGGPREIRHPAQDDDKKAKDEDLSKSADQDKAEQADAKQDEKKEADEKDEKKADAQDDTKADDKKEDATQYKPLEDVSDEIREILIKDKARAEITKRLGQIDVAVSEYGRIYLRAKDKFDEEKAEAKDTKNNLEFVPPPAPDFAKLADELGLKLSETGLTAFDDEQFKKSGLGEAMRVEGGRGVRTVSDVMSSAEFYEPHQFQNFVNEGFFSTWKIEDKEERQPPFDEIRDRVLQAYRMTKARDLAERRANELAAALGQVEGDMDKFREKAGAIDSITIAPTSLWSNSFSLQFMPRSGRTPAELPGIHLPSDELRNKTFALKEREVTVAPNQPKDTYYVVLLTKRESASREDFARSRQFIERQLGEELAAQLYSDWRENLRREAAGKLASVPAGN